MQIRVQSADFFRLAADCRRAGRSDLEREMNAGLRQVVKPVTKAINDAAEDTMPKRGGYRAVLSKSLRVRASKAGRSMSLRLVVFAKGQGEERDIRRLDKGELRHPNVVGHGLGIDGARFKRRLWTTWKPRRRIPGGQRVPNLWSTTKIPDGFVTKTFDRHADKIQRELGEALGRVAEKLAEG